MSLKHTRHLPAPEEIMEQLPLPEKFKEFKEKRDAVIRAIFEGNDKRFLLIIGPCSAENPDPVCEYLSRLAKAQDKVADKILVIPRIYTNKPRTTGEGYKGMLHQPDPEGDSDLVRGIKSIRSLHIKAIGDFGLPAADEMLYPENYAYLSDVLAYHAIGARSVENQQHRLTASGIDAPVGMKNPTSGDLSVMLNSIKAAQLPHRFIYRGWEVETQGNPLAHAVLRGAVEPTGHCVPNYHYEDLSRLTKKYIDMGLANPSIIVDTNHANSMRRFYEQPRIAKEVLHSRSYDTTLSKVIKGLMIESYLVHGKQDVGGSVFGQSITDPCLGWDDTERLIYEIAERV